MELGVDKIQVLVTLLCDIWCARCCFVFEMRSWCASSILVQALMQVEEHRQYNYNQIKKLLQEESNGQHH